MADSPSLPTFRYHPDPLVTGSVEVGGDACACCGEPRGYLYRGPVYTAQEVGPLCPWCIADGSAHRRFEAQFTDPDLTVGPLGWSDVPPEVGAEVIHRTPGFMGWQQEQWWLHCEDAGEFLGPVGSRELRTLWPDAVETVRRMLRQEYRLDGDVETERWFESLSREGQPTCYLFRCLHCRAFGAYADFT